MDQERTSSRLRLLLQLDEAITEELALPSLHCRITEAVTRLAPVPAAALVVLEEDGTVRQVLQRASAAEGTVSLLLEEPGRERLADRLSGLPTGAVTTLPPAPGLPESWAGPCLAVPVRFRRELLGVLLLVPPEQGLEGEEEDVLLSLAGTAGTALENARLYEEARRRQEWLQEAAEISNAMLALGGGHEAVALIAQSVPKLADAELVTAWVADRSGEPMVGAAGQGDGSEELLGSRVDRDDPLAARILSSGRGLRLTAGEQPDRPWLAAVDRVGVGPVLVVPLVGGGLTGLLVAGRRHGRTAYTDTDLDMAETFAGQMAVALDRVAARTAEQRVSQLEDRERIARDLHDHVIQSLFATGLKVQGAERLSSPGVRPRLAEVVRDIDATIRRLRTTIFRLADDAPDGATEAAGLRHAVLAVLTDVAPVLPCSPEVDFEGPVDTATDAALVEDVVAVLREAATNSGRHARARRLAVQVGVGDGSLTLTVEDDGVGIGATTRRSGLANLRRRAEQRGGRLDLEVPVGGGTRLRWTVPLPA